LRPRDLLKLGQLYLNGGTWHGKRVVSMEWVEQSTRPSSELPDLMNRKHLYGFAWHVYRYEVGGRGYTAYFAAGNGGQLVLVFPELDMVVNYNGGAYGEGRKFVRWQVELVPQYIVAAAVSRQTQAPR
jgi:CubicO group peptidase (beta-lactamase class C family)